MKQLDFYAKIESVFAFAHRIIDIDDVCLEANCFIPDNLDDPNVRASFHNNWELRMQTIHTLQHVPIGQRLNDWKPNVFVRTGKIQPNEYVRYYIDKDHNIATIGKCIRISDNGNVLTIVKCYHPDYTMEERKENKKIRKTINEYRLIETKTEIKIDKNDVIGHDENWEKLRVHWGMNVKFQNKYLNSDTIFERACKDEDMIELFRTTRLLDQIYPTHYLRVLDEENRPSFPFQCGQATDEAKPCTFARNTVWVYRRTPAWAHTNPLEIASEKYYCTNHKKAS